MMRSTPGYCEPHFELSSCLSLLPIFTSTRAFAEKSSLQMSVQNLLQWAPRKGIDLLGTGDCCIRDGLKNFWILSKKMAPACCDRNRVEPCVSS